MKYILPMAAMAALLFAGCKKKDEGGAASGSAAAGSSAAPATGGTTAAAKAADPAPAAGKTKSCEELGGKKAGDTCNLKTAPFDVVFTGKFDTTAMQQEPGAVFKITNKFDRPVRINTAQLYVYDKAGKQLEITAGTNKAPYAQDSKAGMLELAVGETKELTHSIGKPNLPPEMDTLQLEIPSWSSGDDKEQFGLDIHDMEKRPKDGWK